MPADSLFTPALFRYLKDLKANNDRDWFKANKDRYEQELKDPAIRFISAFAPHLAKISPHFRADPRPVGGSLFRIYRDTRFSKDKTPYKTHVGLHFRHELGKDVHTPGFYLHLEPGGCFLGVGIWRPPTAAARTIRESIAERGAAWKKAKAGKKFREDWQLEGETLKRPPRGFDPDHPLIEDLKRKDFMAMTKLTQKSVVGAGAPAFVAGSAKAAAPLVRFLCEALSVPY